MKMKAMLAAYGGTIATLLIADAIWLGLVARSFYKEQLGEMMLPSPNLAVASLFYLFFAAALVLLVVSPALKAQSIVMVLAYGAVFGLVTYGTYDITNLATLRNWPVKMSIIDMAWGAFVTALSAAGGYFAAMAVAPTASGTS